MSKALRGMALVAYGLLISMQFCFAGAGIINCPLPSVPNGNGGCTILSGPGPISVPEPATLAVMATGLGILALARFRKRK